MKSNNPVRTDRRHFIRASTGMLAGLTLLPGPGAAETATPPESIHLIGPLEGYAPQVGTLVSMMRWMQDSLVRVVTGLTGPELDFLTDPKANTIGALLLHLAAVEVVYQDITFYGQKDFSAANQKRWGVAMNLGEAARKQFKGKDLAHYLAELEEVRAKTLAELKKRDDRWLAAVDPAFFNNQPTNNHCKWFHVVEHIGNHRGQISLIKKRLPGARE